MSNPNNLENFTRLDLDTMSEIDDLEQSSILSIANSDTTSDIVNLEQLSIDDLLSPISLAPSIDDIEEMKEKIANILNNLDVNGESNKIIDFFHILALISAGGEITYNVENLDNEIVNFILNSEISSYEVEGFQPLDETVEIPSTKAFQAFMFFHLFALALCELNLSDSVMPYLQSQFLTLKDSLQVTNLITLAECDVSTDHTPQDRFCMAIVESLNELGLNEEQTRQIRYWFNQTVIVTRPCFASVVYKYTPLLAYEDLTGVILNRVRNYVQEELNLDEGDETFDKINRLLFYIIFFDKLLYFMVF